MSSVNKSNKRYSGLTSEQVKHFMEHGYVTLPGVFTREIARKVTSDVWTRLGMDPDDKTTWNKEWINMPAFNYIPIEECAPKAWEAIGDLVGGHDRIVDDPQFRCWHDGWIVNLGKTEYDAKNSKAPSAKELVGLNKQTLRNDNVGWHCDGDWFFHFLDSGEQALLIVPIYTDILPGGGGTYIAPQSIAKIAKWMADKPEGVHPTEFDFTAIKDECDEFVELTGNAGDETAKTDLQIITNASTMLREPYNLKRSDPEDYCIVELKTLQALGVDPNDGYDFKPTTERRRIVPERQLRQDAEKLKETDRLVRAGKAKVPGAVASVDRSHDYSTAALKT